MFTVQDTEALVVNVIACFTSGVHVNYYGMLSDVFVQTSLMASCVSLEDDALYWTCKVLLGRGMCIASCGLLWRYRHHKNGRHLPIFQTMMP